jgi:hypothetical protein
MSRRFGAIQGFAIAIYHVTDGLIDHVTLIDG